MYTETVKIKLKCPKHVRYDPSRDGLGGIKGGCVECTALWDMFHCVRLLTGYNHTSKLDGSFGLKSSGGA